MYAIFETLEAYQAKNQELNAYLGYPNVNGTERYATDEPQQTIDGKYAMPIRDEIAHLFVGCEILETVEYPEVQDDI